MIAMRSEELKRCCKLWYMKFPSYEVVLPADDATCVEYVDDHNNQYGGRKHCGKPACLSAKQESGGSMRPLCMYHFGELMSGQSLLEHQIVTTLLVDMLRREKQD